MNNWIETVVKQDEIDKYLIDGEDFINDELIEEQLKKAKNPSKQRVKKIIEKSKKLQRLEPEETAVLLNVEDPSLLQEIFQAANTIKNKVYGNRIVTFAPLYCSNYCVNNCLYCGFKKENSEEKRIKLNSQQIQKEAKSLIDMGHKRLIMVYGEHPTSDVDYMVETIKNVYATKNENGEIRRVNINAAPMETAKLKQLHDVGIGTFQVFQETYHHETYKKMHPSGLKSNFQWRLYAMHRAYEAGIDDFGIGALFGLYDWKFEVMGLMYHTIDLERRFDGIGPHTISFPRIENASSLDKDLITDYTVSDDEFKRLVAILRLSVPYTGLIITARESADIRKQVISLGCTQTDASSNIKIGGYSEQSKSDSAREQQLEEQQFELGDTRSLDEVIAEFIDMGYVTSFCTAGYRCGRTGMSFMELAKTGQVHQFCMPNAILTFKEYLMDYASPQTKQNGNKLIEKEVLKLSPSSRDIIKGYLNRIENGERDLRF